MLKHTHITFAAWALLSTACNAVLPAAQATTSSTSAAVDAIFGAGLMEKIPDAAILANKQANLRRSQSLNIAGHENRNGNTGTIARSGWKAQNASLEIFSGEAYNVEIGVTNTLFQVEREENNECALNGSPEDSTNFLPIVRLAGAPHGRPAGRRHPPRLGGSR